VYEYLLNIAADAAHYYLDGTTNRILDQKSIEKKMRNSDKLRTRTGIYTSGVIATTSDAQRIVLFETNIGHAGEFIDKILLNRASSSSPPCRCAIVMHDVNLLM